MLIYIMVNEIVKHALNEFMSFFGYITLIA